LDENVLEIASHLMLQTACATTSNVCRADALAPTKRTISRLFDRGRGTKALASLGTAMTTQQQPKTTYWTSPRRIQKGTRIDKSRIQLRNLERRKGFGCNGPLGTNPFGSLSS
jgi:hypothetical protein